MRIHDQQISVNLVSSELSETYSIIVLKVARREKKWGPTCWFPILRRDASFKRNALDHSSKYVAEQSLGVMPRLIIVLLLNPGLA